MENNHNTKEQEGIDAVLEKIEKNEVAMKPRSGFRWRFAVLIGGIVLLFLLSIFLSTFMLFTFRASGRAVFLGFGPSGWKVFLFMFPWTLFIACLALVALIEWVLRSFKFGYRIPVLYLFGAVICVMMLIGLLVDRAHVHDDLLRLSHQHRLPMPFGRFYEREGMFPPPPPGFGIFRGTVTAVGTSTLGVNVEDTRKSTTTPFTVLFGKLRFEEKIAPGDSVFIFGEVKGETIVPRSVRLAPGKFR